MSVPSQPPDPLRGLNTPGACTPRTAAPDTGATPPIIADDELENYPNLPEQPEQDDTAGESQDGPSPRRPRLGQPPRGQRIARKTDNAAPALTGEQRLLLLDTWRRSGLPAGDFAALVGISKHTLYSWKPKFETEGPAGLDDKTRGGPSGSRLSEVTKRAILMMKQDNPDWGCERISALLLRGPALPASPQAVARVLHEAGYQTEEGPTRPHPDKIRHFERARPMVLSLET